MAAGRRNVGSRRPHFGIRRQLRTPLVNSIDQFVSGARIVFCKVGPDLGDVTLKAWKIGSDLHSARLRRFASSRRPASFIRRTVAWSKGRGSPLAPPSSHIWRSCSRVCPKSARRSCHCRSASRTTSLAFPYSPEATALSTAAASSGDRLIRSKEVDAQPGLRRGGSHAVLVMRVGQCLKEGSTCCSVSSMGGTLSPTAIETLRNCAISVSPV